MSGVEHLGLFIVAGLLLNLTPGPDVLFVVSQSLRAGRRAGMVAALGVAAGIFVHILAAGLGLSAVLASSATAFTVLKWLGVAYLLYVGWTLLGFRFPANATEKIANYTAATRSEGQIDYKKIAWQGFWTNALNPKVALFFLAFVPQFISADAANKPLTFVLLGLLFNLNALPVNLGYALRAAWAGARLQRWRGGIRWFERLAGTLFIGFGLKLALAHSPSP
jgi:threonine/homoserine/homoserine lactone efflux protein